MTEHQTEALSRARNGDSFANYMAILEGFASKGIATEDITPRVNVFTFHAWKALGRSVMKGEHGVKLVTWVPMQKRNSDGAEESFKTPRTVTVFHISQTKALDETAPAVTPAEREHVQQQESAQFAYSEEFTQAH